MAGPQYSQLKIGGYCHPSPKEKPKEDKAVWTKLLTRTVETAYGHHCDGMSHVRKRAQRCQATCPRPNGRQAARQHFRLKSHDSKFKALLFSSISHKFDFQAKQAGQPRIQLLLRPSRDFCLGLGCAYREAMNPLLPLYPQLRQRQSSAEMVLLPIPQRLAGH